MSKSVPQAKAQKQRRFPGFGTLRIGPVEISAADRGLDLQAEALEQAKLRGIFSDRNVSGMKAEQPELDRTLDRIRSRPRSPLPL